MNIAKQHFGSSQSLMALALLAAFSPAQAEEGDDIAQLIKPESSVSVGIGAVSGDSQDRARFGLYNGMRKESAYGLIDIDYINREDATGTWTTLEGRNLGLDNRELRFSLQKQGDWKITGDYSELVKRDFRTINTADLGVGTTTPTVVRLATIGAGSDVDLKLKRVGLGLGVEKWLSPGLQFEASFKNEDKDGARFWGRGYDCAAYVCGPSTVADFNNANYATTYVKNALLMMAEPVNSNTKQFEAKFNFHDEKLNLSAAYYGSFYTNSNGNLTSTVPNTLNNGLLAASTLYPAVTSALIAGGGTSLQNVLQLPMALPPDNQAQQLSLSGNYAFTPTTNATFKYAYTHATQNQDFGTMGLTGAPGGVSNLDGRVDSTLAQFGLTAKPIPKLSLLANIRYERKEDKTPNALYNTEARQIYPDTARFTTANNVNTYTAVRTYTNAFQANVTPTTWDNNHVSNTKLDGKLEASYQLPENTRATLGLDYKSIERLVPQSLSEEVVAGLTALREKNDETGYRLELKSILSETLTGAIGYSNSKRRGSDWTSLSTLDPAFQALVAADGNYASYTPSATTRAANVTAALANIALINTYCGGRTCYGQKLSEASILALSSTAAFPMNMTNIDREKWKLSANWTPMERLSLQFNVEDGKDENVSLTNAFSGKGYRGTKLSFYNIDADYAVTDNWKLTAYWSYGDQRQNINHSTGYVAEVKNLNDAVGVGLLGNLNSRLEMGANLSYLNDVTKYRLAVSPTANGVAPTGSTLTTYNNNIAQAIIGLPDVNFRQTTLSLFGKYALEKNADVRVELVHQRSKLNEWTWGYNGTPFVYADNTTVSAQQEQNVTFIGAAYIYKMK